MTNRQRLNLILIAVLLAPAGAGAQTIAFGSCLRQWNPQPVWEGILGVDPDAFVFVGDNVYTDTGPNRWRPEPQRIGDSYRQLGQNPGFRALRESVPVYATWDDHDYGRNDAGAEYPFKDESKSYFMTFFDVPPDDPMRERDGIYSVRYLGTGADRVQLLLLDTRSFRSPLTRAEPTPECPRVRYAPRHDAEATLLGESQWRWLQDRLREPAALRILVSGIQVIPREHCFEKWANLPRERQRLFDLIRDTGAGGVVLVSGDRHLAEISRLPPETVGYPLYELTTSGLNSAGAGAGEPNRFRTTPDNVREDNFGLIRYLPTASPRRLLLEIRGVDGTALVSESLALDRLSFQAGAEADSGR